MTNTGKQALLHLCYAAVNACALKRGKFDPGQQAELAEAMAKRIGEWLEKDACSIVTLTPYDIGAYEYLCEILDHIQQSLPTVANHFNVVLKVERFDYLENHATTATHGHQGGKA